MSDAPTPSLMSRYRDAWSVASVALALMFFTAVGLALVVLLVAGHRTPVGLAVGVYVSALPALALSLLAVIAPGLYGRPPLMLHLVVALPVLFWLFTQVAVRLTADLGFAIFSPPEVGRPDRIWQHLWFTGLVAVAQAVVLALAARAARRDAAK